MDKVKVKINEKALIQIRDLTAQRLLRNKSSMYSTLDFDRFRLQGLIDYLFLQGIDAPFVMEEK